MAFGSPVPCRGPPITTNTEAPEGLESPIGWQGLHNSKTPTWSVVLLPSKGFFFLSFQGLIRQA